MTKAAEKPQEPAQGDGTTPEPQSPPEGENAPQEGADAPTEADELAAAERQGTKGATFQEAAQVADEQERVLPIQETSTDRLAAEGESKGLTFAEQAEKAAELYGSGNPADRTED